MTDTDINKIKDEMIIAAARAYTRGIQTGSGGNFSARVTGEKLMILKSSGGSFMDATRENLLITDFEGRIVEGSGKPTREAFLHGLVYKIAPHINGVMHCHSPWAIGWASTKQDLDKVTYHQQLKFGCPIPTLDVKAPVVGVEDFPKIEKLFKKYPQLLAFLLVDHGVVAVGDTIINAEHNAELVEETAKIALLKGLAAIIPK